MSLLSKPVWTTCSMCTTPCLIKGEHPTWQGEKLSSHDIYSIDNTACSQKKAKWILLYEYLKLKGVFFIVKVLFYPCLICTDIHIEAIHSLLVWLFDFWEAWGVPEASLKTVIFYKSICHATDTEITHFRIN